MNDHTNEEQSLSSTGETKPKTKGTGYLRAKSPKPKKVASLFSPKEQSEALNMPQQHSEVPSIIQQNNSNIKTSEKIPNKIIEQQKKFEKPNPYKKINQSNIRKSEDEQDSVYHSKNNDTPGVINQETQKNEIAQTTASPANNNRSFKKPFKSKKYRDNKPRFDNNKDDDTLDIPLEVVKERPVSDSALSLLRQRTGFEPNIFWKELDSLQKSNQPIDFSKEISTFITHAVLFNKEDVYLELMERYGQFLKPEDFEGHLIAYCANRPSYFLDKTIYMYDKLIGNKTLLTDLLIDKLTNCSFREENNFIWLSWLDKNATDEQFKHFFEYAFECHNIVVILESLHFKNLSNYMRNNLSLFQKSIDECPQSYNLLSSLKNPDYYIDRANKMYDKEIEYSFKQFENSLQSQIQPKEKKIEKKEFKEDNVTEVIVKKKKTIEPTPNASPFL